MCWVDAKTISYLFTKAFRPLCSEAKTFALHQQVDFTAKPTYWRPLYPPVKLKLGELLVSLTYLPAKNTLTIGILKAKNLKAKDINGLSGKEKKVHLFLQFRRHFHVYMKFVQRVLTSLFGKFSSTLFMECNTG